MSNLTPNLRASAIEEELAELRRKRTSLRQQEVNTVEANASSKAARTRAALLTRDVRPTSAPGVSHAEPEDMTKHSSHRYTDPLEGINASVSGSASQDSLLLSSLSSGTKIGSNEPVTIGGTTLTEGMRVVVKNDPGLIRGEATRTTSQYDRMKEIYCGERGKIVKIYNQLSNDDIGVDLEFADGETRFFTLPCIDVPGAPGEASAKRKTTGKAQEKAAPPTAKPSKAAPPPPTRAKTSQPPPPVQSQAPPSPTSEIKVGQRILVNQAGKTIRATVRYIGTTQFAEGDWVGLELSSADGKNDGSVNGVSYFTCPTSHGLFRRLSDFSGRSSPPQTGSSTRTPSHLHHSAPKTPVKPGGKGTTPTPASSSSSTAAAPPATPSSSSAAASSTPKPAKPAVKRTAPAAPPPKVAKLGMTKTVRVWENGQYGSTVDTVPFKSVVVRPVHKTMKSIFITAARELGWHQLKRSVEMLFREDGTCITDPAEIEDGMNLVASWGDAFVPPEAPLSRAERKGGAAPSPSPVPDGDGQENGATPARQPPTTPSRSAPKAISRNRSPAPFMKKEGTAPIPTRIGGGNKTVKVFENGSYGSQWSDTVPYITVTIRSTFRTMQAVKTMLTRELKWNQMGRKVEVVYNTLAEELNDVSCISNGDTIIASSGDQFIAPHDDVAERLPPPKLSVSDVVSGAPAGGIPDTSLISSPPADKSPSRHTATRLTSRTTPPEHAFDDVDEEEPRNKPSGITRAGGDRIAELMAEIHELESKMTY